MELSFTITNLVIQTHNFKFLQWSKNYIIVNSIPGLFEYH